MKNKIGVYICYCGSNISDYVDVERVRDEMEELEGIKLAKTCMFACADSTQKEMVQDVKEKGLDAIVVASCSPKLHLHTFRNVAIRAGLNPYNYVQVNIREQTSWAHSNTPDQATIKAINMVKSGIARVKHSQNLEPLKISSENTALVIGAGMAGMRAAIELSEMGTKVYLIEREHFVGGRTSQWSRLFTSNESGEEVVKRVYEKVDKDPNITLFTGANLVSLSGTVGDFNIKIKITPRYVSPACKTDESIELQMQLKLAMDVCPVEVEDDFNFNITKRKALYNSFDSEFPHCPAIDDKNCTRCGKCEKHFEHIDFDQKEESLDLNVGAIVVATGFDPYEPEKGEFAYGELENVITLPQFKRLLEIDEHALVYQNKPIKNIAYIYCVGSRQVEGENKYCSRYCCTSAIHAATHAKDKFKDIHNFHFTRGIRTYGKQELIYNQALENHDIFLQFNEDEPPKIEQVNGQTLVKVNDILTQVEELEAVVDLVVLVTGMVPRKENSIAEILKIPIGRDKFFNEIHPKLKPVETLIDGIFICGACQAPFNISESVKSSLSAASKANALISRGKIELEPTIANINAENCNWCDNCTDICSVDAIIKNTENGKVFAEIDESKCKGCGMCLPVCPENAIDLIGYTEKEIESMIDALVSEAKLETENIKS